MLQMR